MGGRPPTPSALKKLRGETRASRLNADEPQPPVGAQPPKWLSKAARAVWAVLAPGLEETRVLTQADAVALGNLCELQAELNRQVKRGQMSNKLAGEIRQHLGRFGLTPADRVRVKGQPKKDDPDPFAVFDGQLKVVDGGKARRG